MMISFFTASGYRAAVNQPTMPPQSWATSTQLHGNGDILHCSNKSQDSKALPLGYRSAMDQITKPPQSWAGSTQLHRHRRSLHSLLIQKTEGSQATKFFLNLWKGNSASSFWPRRTSRALQQQQRGEETPKIAHEV